MTITYFNRNTELRKIKVETLKPVIDILSENDSWKTLMRQIPEDPHDLTSARRYNEKHELYILQSEAGLNGRKKFAEILFDEWGCTGRLGYRPTLGSLKKILSQAKLFQAANEVSNLLNEPITEPNFHHSPGPPVPVIEDILQDSDTIEVSISNNNESSPLIQPSPSSHNLQNTGLENFEYEYLKRITNNFRHHIGSGGFGHVFKGYDERFGFLAIKRTRTQELKFSSEQPDYKKAFDTEVRSLSMLRHENIVPIVGVSKDGPACIVIQVPLFPYIDGGSLTKKIAEKVLKEDERLKIIIGIAEGLKYIHHSVKPFSSAQKNFYFIHGDVKTDNILLTRDLVPKLCDFGLSKQITSSGMFTIHINGTNPYIAPECFRGMVIQQSDIYSFGIVLLQLLTGLEPIIETPEGKFDILSYIKKHSVNGNLSKLLDTSVKWTKAQKIFEIAKQCLLDDKDKRPSMAEICEKLPYLT